MTIDVDTTDDSQSGTDADQGSGDDEETAEVSEMLAMPAVVLDTSSFLQGKFAL